MARLASKHDFQQYSQEEMDILARFSEEGCFFFKFESKSLVVQHGERWQLKNRAVCHPTKKCSPPNLLEASFSF